jgi:hypothetical protein
MDCVAWLSGYLKTNGETEYRLVKYAAAAAGYKKSDLKAAREKLHVETRRYDDNWFWYLEGAK